MSEESEMPSEPLASQMGSDIQTLSEGKFDMEILSVIQPRHIRPLLYFSIDGEKNELSRELVEHFLKLKRSEGGRGLRDILRMESVRHGGAVNLESEIEKPNWFARHIYDRNWEDKERERLGLDKKGENA
jgi:hypothetical protein